jgi:hypothetical protein
MANIFGVQCQFDAAETLRYNREVQPTAVMGINVDKTEWWRQIRAENEDVWSVFRFYPDPHFDNLGSPEEAAEWAVAILHDKIGHLLAEGLITHVVDGNEDIQAGHYDLHSLRDRYGSAFIMLAREQLGVGAWWGNFFCGHFGEETVDLFPLSLAAMEEDNIAYPDNPSAIAFHEYDWPYLDRVWRESGEHWLCGKFLKAMPPILARYPNAKCAITEFGIDSGAAGVSGEHQGWRKASEQIVVARELLCGGRGLQWYYPLTLQDYLLAVLWFGCGMGGDWRSRGFDIMEGEDDVAVMERVKQFEGWEPPPPPPLPTEGTMRVFDIDGNEVFGQAALDLIAYHGITVHPVTGLFPPRVAPGEWYWDIVKMEVREGPACFIFTVLDATGNPVEGKETAWGWQGMSEDDNDIEVGYVTDHFTRADIGLSNAEGNNGPGFGQSGWWHEPNQPGPGLAWVRDPNRWAVLLTGIGMQGGTNHRTMYATWQEKVYTGEEPPPPPSDGLGEELDQMGDRLKQIAQTVGSGGVTGLVVTYADGTQQQFAPTGIVATARRFIKTMFGR